MDIVTTQAMGDDIVEVRVSDGEYRDICEFLFREARLLDRGEFREWLTLLSPDIHYKLSGPTIAMSRPGKETPPPEVTMMDENFSSLRARVQQLSTPALTIADNPRSFTRRFVTNIIVDSLRAGSYQVQSNALIYRSRGSQGEPHLFSTTRVDHLTRGNGKIVLVRRLAHLDESIVGTRNISTIF